MSQARLDLYFFLLGVGKTVWQWVRSIHVYEGNPIIFHCGLLQPLGRAQYIYTFQELRARG